MIKPQGKRVDLCKDIKDAEDAIKKHGTYIKDLFTDEKENVLPQNDKLFIKWFMAGKHKLYTIVCQCENNKLVRVPGVRGLRCHECGTFHSWDSWIKIRAEIHRIASFNDGLIEKINQRPQNYQKLNKKIVYNVKTKRFETRDKTLSELKAEFDRKIK